MRNFFKYYIRFFLFSFPVFFLPLIVDGYGMGKNWWLVTGAIIGLILWVLDQIVNKRENIGWNKALALGLAGTVWAVFTWVKMPLGPRMESLLNPVGLGTVAALMIWVFLWLQVRNERESRIQLNWLTAAGILAAVTSLATFMIPAAKLPFNFPKENPLISINNGWSVTGSLLAELMLMVFLASEWIKRLVAKLNDRRSDYIGEGVLTAVALLVTVLDIYKIFKLGWVTLDGQSAWIIAVETFKRSPIFGIGIGNFAQAFELYRPASFNLTSVWSSGFSLSSMGILQIWTETGLVGILLTLLGVSQLLKEKKNFDFWRALAVVLGVLILPLNFMALFLLAWISANLIFERKELGFSWRIKMSFLSKYVNLPSDEKINVLPWMALVIVLTGGFFGGWNWVNFLKGELFYRQSLVAAGKNDGTNTYNLLIQAIGVNPYKGEFRRVYSQTNMALAAAILSNKDATDADKEKASVLIQQAVREGKAAIALDNLNAGYWTNLAAIYKNLIGVVDGSADWSLQAYQQAAAFDSVNPMIKLDLGGLLFAAERYEEADRVFEQAVTAKADFANGWYNWAYSAKKMNKLYDAVTRLNQAVALVPADSGDYENASKELDAWKKELEEAIKKQEAELKQLQEQQAKQPETLKAPQALPTVGAEEKVNIPAEEMEPPKPSESDMVPEPKEENPSPTKGMVTPSVTP